IRDERRVRVHLLERHVERLRYDRPDAGLDVGSRRAHRVDPEQAVRAGVSNASAADSPDEPMQPDTTRAPGEVFNSSASSVGGAAASAKPSASAKSTGTSRPSKTSRTAATAARL